MEIITTYVNNLFNGLPADERLDKAKEDLLAIMEEHYIDLKAEGKSENEAIGTVISQFGNIDELLEELDIKTAQPEPEQPAQPDNSIHLSEEEALDYIKYRKGFGWRMAIGVMLCILAPASLIALSTILSNMAGMNGDMADSLALVSLLALIAAAVCMFIINGIRNEKYEKYEKQRVTLPESTAKLVEQKQEENKMPFALSICFGLVFIFLGIITIGVVDALFGGIDLAEDLCGAALLALVSIGVMLMVRGGIGNESFKHLLNIEKKITEAGEPAKKKGGVAMAVFNAVLWPLTVIIYLVWSFVGGGWSISWIVFPVAALLSGIMGAVVGAINNEQ